MATQRELADQASRLWDRARSHLIQTLQPGGRYAAVQGTPSAYNEYRPLAGTGGGQQGLAFQNGQMPSDAAISQFLASQPEYQSLLKQMQKARVAGAGGGKPSSGPAGSSVQQPASDPLMLFKQLWAATQAAEDQKNAVVEGRYAEGKDELTSLRDRNQERVGNWGYAAQADIDERMKEAVGNATANAAARGMSNSNITDAYRLRAARDTAREQQRVSEARDSRLAEYDTNDTNNIAGWIERRNDVGPDYSNLLAMALQYGQGESQRQAAERQQAALMAAYRASDKGRSNLRLPPIPGPQGGVSPVFMNGTPVQMAAGLLGGAGARIGIGSNRYPTPRGSGSYIPLANQQQGPSSLHGLQILPTYQRPTNPLMIPGGPNQGPYYA